jgi:hypothetical protein
MTEINLREDNIHTSAPAIALHTYGLIASQRLHNCTIFLDVYQSIPKGFVKNYCGFPVLLAKPFMASPCANTHSFQQGEGILIGRNVLRQMQGEEDRSRRPDYFGKNREGS